MSIFFVLSGFVLTWSIGADPSPVRFYRRRFARIYPATLVTGLVTAGLLSAGWFDLRGGAVPFRSGALGAVTSILLIQAWFPQSYPVHSHNPVAWSLSREAFFYALLPLLVAKAAGWGSRKVVPAMVGVAGAGVLLTLALVNVRAFDVAYSNPLVRLPEFLVGVGLGLLVLHGWRPSVRLWQAGALLLVGAVIAHQRPSWFPLGDYLVLPGFVAVLLSGITSDLKGSRGFLTTRFSVYLGEVSFCFYLVHYITLRAVVYEAGWDHQHFSLIGGLVPLTVTSLACLAVAAALHHSVELPMQRLLRPKRQAV